MNEPFAYTVGFADFLDCHIDLRERTLIPRPETEFWVNEAIKSIGATNDLNKTIKCLDIFSGSGCIGLAILKHIPNALVDFADFDPRAIRQITLNTELNGIDISRFKIIKSNIFENVEGQYDYIFANPPYIAEDKKSDVQDSVLNYEPHTALFAGTDGLLYIKAFLSKAKNYLKEGGKIYMEFDSHEKDSIENILKANGFNKFNFYQDQFQRWRYLSLET